MLKRRAWCPSLCSFPCSLQLETGLPLNTERRTKPAASQPAGPISAPFCSADNCSFPPVSYCPLPLQGDASAETPRPWPHGEPSLLRDISNTTCPENAAQASLKTRAAGSGNELLLKNPTFFPLTPHGSSASVHRAPACSIAPCWARIPPKAKGFSEHHPRICHARMLWQGRGRRAPRPWGSLQGEGSSKLPQHTGTGEETSNRKLPADAPERGSSWRPLRALR